MGRTEAIEGAALLDTGNLAGDFISRDCLFRIGGLTHCYPSPASMTVCSGLNGTCYVSATVMDIGVIFLSYDNIVHTVYLTVLVNPEAIIDLLLGRATLSQYNIDRKSVV